MNMTLTLSPIKQKMKPIHKWDDDRVIIDTILVMKDGYVWGTLHVDVFHDKENKDIYNRLLSGEVVVTELTIKKDDVSKGDLKVREEALNAYLAGVPG